LFTLVLVLSLSLVTAVPAAAVGPPTIDGVITSGEWTGATVIPVANSMGTVYAIAHADYLYVLFDVVDSTDARLGENLIGNDKISMNINPTPGAPWGMPCDIIFETGTDPAAWPIGPTCGQTDGYETNWVINGSQAALPADVLTMTLYNYTAGKRISEWKIPLASIAPLPDTLKVGGACDNLHAPGGAQGNSYRYPDGLDWGDVDTYVDVSVSQPTSVVGLTAAVPDIVAISASPTSIDFGILKPGDTSATFDITVENIGTRTVDVGASATGSALFENNLLLRNLPKTWSDWVQGTPWSKLIEDFVMGASDVVQAKLPVPIDYTPLGPETATLIFEATAK